MQIYSTKCIFHPILRTGEDKTNKAKFYCKKIVILSRIFNFAYANPKLYVQ